MGVQMKPEAQQQQMALQVKIRDLRNEARLLNLLHSVAACDAKDVALTDEVMEIAGHLSNYAQNLMMAKQELGDEKLGAEMGRLLRETKWTYLDSAGKAAAEALKAQVPGTLDEVARRLHERISEHEGELGDLMKTKGRLGKELQKEVKDRTRRLVVLKTFLCTHFERDELIRDYEEGLINGVVARETVKYVVDFQPTAGKEEIAKRMEHYEHTVADYLAELRMNSEERGKVFAEMDEASKELGRMGVKFESGGMLEAIVEREQNSGMKLRKKEAELAEAIDRFVRTQKEFKIEVEKACEEDLKAAAAFWAAFPEHPLAPPRAALSRWRLAQFAEKDGKAEEMKEHLLKAAEFGEEELKRNYMNLRMMERLFEIYKKLGDEENAKAVQGKINAHKSIFDIQLTGLLRTGVSR